MIITVPNPDDGSPMQIEAAPDSPVAESVQGGPLRVVRYDCSMFIYSQHGGFDVRMVHGEPTDVLIARAPTHVAARGGVTHDYAKSRTRN